MGEDELIRLGDWHRMLLGDAPVEFMVEVFFRTIFLYILLLIVLRLLGKQMAAQASILEMTVMITLGAIVGLPMQDPATGLANGVVILVCVLSIQRLTNWYSYKNKKFEEYVKGQATLLIKDGTLNLNAMRKAKLSQNQLFSLLRGEKIQHLGTLQRVYLEASGDVSIFKFKNPRSGLTIIPDEDKALSKSIQFSQEDMVCTNCGTIKSEDDCCKGCNLDNFSSVVRA